MSVTFTVRRSAAAGRDLALIFDYLADAYAKLGDDPSDALDRAAERILGIDAAMERLGRAPFQGTLREDLIPGLRQVTKDSAIFYFLTHAAQKQVDVLAVFFGGQDHQRHMLRRLLEEERGVVHSFVRNNLNPTPAWSAC